ncbi:uncharacterized protein BDCG_17663 [Blastomyces dermatitidis ER-3]|uniref:Uncharacterized protein n=2 Tax=Ajellomyces dermatitidis TaxID=5039 RepID=A0A0J9HHR8_AJEDA|nr:uncharacterized protein BDCG_17663 [Blastomyces dermatitidis ER-3]KMW68684.1 hypothetical protein BDDG_12973 [Blastomyces dermatitidis ATCC 18188]OAT02600.1 hypothetical protein BDCG_17663 [Blastomyces dermatitidis ER-3]
MEDEEAVTYAMTGLYYTEAKDWLDHLGNDHERSRWPVLKAYLENKCRQKCTDSKGAGHQGARSCGRALGAGHLRV